MYLLKYRPQLHGAVQSAVVGENQIEHSLTEFRSSFERQDLELRRIRSLGTGTVDHGRRDIDTRRLVAHPAQHDAIGSGAAIDVKDATSRGASVSDTFIHPSSQTSHHLGIADRVIEVNGVCVEGFCKAAEAAHRVLRVARCNDHDARQ